MSGRANTAIEPQITASGSLAAAGSESGQNLFASPYTALAASLVLVVTMTLVTMTRARSTKTQIPAPASLDRRRNRRIAACTTLRIRVTSTHYPATEVSLLNASTGGVALEWSGPTLPIDLHVRLDISGYSAVQAVVVAQDGSLLRLRFADAASRGEREWLRLACLSGDATGYGMHAA